MAKIIFYCMDMPQFVYPLISWWTLGFFPTFWLLHNTAVNIQVFVWMFSVLLGDELLDRLVTLFNIWRNCFSQFTFPPSMYEGSYSSIPHLYLHLSVFVITVVLLGVRWSNCDFNLLFLNSKWAVFHVFIGQLYVFFGARLIQIDWPFFNWITYLFIIKL